MSTRTLIILMIISAGFITGGIGCYGWIVTWVAELWHIKSPLIFIFCCGVGSGVGLFGFVAFSAGAIQNTKSRIKKQMEQRKTLEVIRRVK